MGYACYEHNGRDQGYGVPALCDHPGCNAKIDRGIAYACGGDPMRNCGLFFCDDHRANYSDDADASHGVCERCAKGEASFKPKPDIQEWNDWKLSDPSWADFRASSEDWVAAHRGTRASAKVHILSHSSIFGDPGVNRFIGWIFVAILCGGGIASVWLLWP